MLETRTEPFEVRPEQLLPFDGSALLYRSYLSEAVADRLLSRLEFELDWSQEFARLFGKKIPLPRLTAWYGSRPYAYSGVVHPTRGLPPLLQALQREIEPVAFGVNCVLGNYYRDGNDSVSWHADDDEEAGDDPLICSISFGETRRFLFRHRGRAARIETELRRGDVLVMSGETQRHWQHMVPKANLLVGPRINMTFRRFMHAPVTSE